MPQFQKIKVSSLFSIHKVKSLNEINLTPPSANNIYPYITRTSINNGVKGYTGFVDKEHLNDAGTFSLGLLGMTLNYQNKPWYAGQFVRRIVPLKHFSPNALLFLQAHLEKMTQLFDPQAIRETDDIFNKATITLPVTTDGSLDTVYMSNYISKKKQGISNKIRQFLAKNGYKNLDDCNLTNYDKNILCNNPKMKSFKTDAIFHKLDLGWIGKHKFNKLLDASTKKTKEFSLPLLNAKHGNNGIMFYGRPNEWETANNIVDVVSNGAVATGDVYFQPNTVSVMWDAYALDTIDNVPVKAKVYLTASLKRAIKLIFGWEDKAVWSKVKKIDILLPVTNLNKPDWQYMNNYVKAIEKLQVQKVMKLLNK